VYVCLYDLDQCRLRYVFPKQSHSVTDVAFHLHSSVIVLLLANNTFISYDIEVNCQLTQWSSDNTNLIPMMIRNLPRSLEGTLH
jgi:hypothetical protein